MRFAAIGIDHAHIFDHINGLLAAGAEFAGYCPRTTVPAVLEGLKKNFPQAPEMDRDAVFADRAIDVICTAAIPSDRARIAVRAMRAGKDVMVDKPGVTNAMQLDAVRQAVAETGRIFSVCFSERLCVRSAVKAGRLVQQGAIGRVIQTLGMGPHQKGTWRPDWFWQPALYGGILVDIASHQIDQFLYYTGSTSAEVVASQIGNFDTPAHPDFQDFGDLMLRSNRGSGYVRVDWFTPDGLGCWGDGRLTILGTQGYIELRKYIDIQGRPGGGHLFMANHQGSQYIHCGDEKLDYFDQFVADVRDRTETAMTQAHVFEVCRLSLDAQARAVRIAAQTKR
jgi:predicted dehydrogenase